MTNGRAACGEQGVRGHDLAGVRGRDERIDARRVSALGARGEHVLGKRQHDGTRTAGHRDPVRMRQVFGNALRAIDLRNPLGYAAVHLAIVDFLERFAVDHVAADLADEDDHRRGILSGCVNADGRIRRARAAGHKRKSGAAGELAMGLRHVRGATLLPANDESESVADTVHRVEDSQIALAGNAESEGRVLREQAGDEDLAARTGGHGGCRHVREPESDGADSTRRATTPLL